jgi:hypothetical protein
MFLQKDKWTYIIVNKLIRHINKVFDKWYANLSKNCKHSCMQITSFFGIICYISKVRRLRRNEEDCSNKMNDFSGI